MENRVNKPRVFLSHAAEDKPFINQLSEDLKKHQIDPWLDSEEIRDGRPWLKAIFEDGIPTCDCVVVYFTKHSLKSDMVKKELDATVVEQLDQSGIVLLPYISDSSLRDKLRPDLRALQCKEWNSQNYDVMLPRVVGEIWRSYVERTVDIAQLHEKNRRLEVEAENTRLKEQFAAALFSPREEKEFQFLFDKLNRQVTITLGLSANSKTVGSEVIEVNLIYLLVNFISQGNISLDTYDLVFALISEIGPETKIEEYGTVERSVSDGLGAKGDLELQNELNTYGLTTITRVQWSDRSESSRQIADKMYRFKYWLEYNGRYPESKLRHGVKLRESISDPPKISRGQTAVLNADHRISLAKRRRNWRVNGEGTAAASAAIPWIFTKLKERAEWSNQESENIRLEVTDPENDAFTLGSGSLKLELLWSCPTVYVGDAEFNVTINDVRLEQSGDSTEVSLEKQFFSVTFEVDVNSDLDLTWYRKGSGRGDPYSKEDLADYCWETFLSTVTRREEGTI